MSKQAQEAKVDHKEEAREMVEFIINGSGDPRNPGASAYLIGAQAHALLYIGEQLERVAEILCRPSAEEQRRAMKELADAESEAC